MWHICRAALAMREGNTPACITEIKHARNRLAVGLQYWADNGNLPPFRDWIKSPHSIRAKGQSTVLMIDDLLSSLQGAARTPAEKERMDKVFQLPKQGKWK